MKPSDVTDAIKGIKKYKDIFLKNPLFYKRDLYALLDRPFAETKKITQPEMTKLMNYLDAEQCFLDQLQHISQKGFENGCLDVACQKDLESIIRARWTSAHAAGLSALDAAPALLNYAWLRLTDNFSVVYQIPFESLSGALGRSSPDEWSCSLKKKLTKTFAQFTALHFETFSVNKSVWSCRFQEWFTQSLLCDFSYSNQDLSALYYSRVDDACLLHYFFVLRSVQDQYVVNRHIYTLIQWIQQVFGLESISEKTHQALWHLVSESACFTGFYRSSVEQTSLITQALDKSFWIFYYDVYLQLPMHERRVLDQQYILQSMGSVTFGRLIQEAMGPRTRFLHVLNALPFYAYGMEMDYLFVKDTQTLYYVNYINQQIEWVQLDSLAYFLKIIHQLPQINVNPTTSEYKLYLDDQILLACITRNGGHVPQRIQQSCMINFFENLLPLLISYDPYTRLPASLEAFSDERDYFGLSNKESQGLWGDRKPYLLERLRYHSFKQYFSEFEQANPEQLLNYLTYVIVSLLTYRFYDQSCTLIFKNFSQQNKGPQVCAALLSWINEQLASPADLKFIVGHLVFRKLPLIKTHLAQQDHYSGILNTLLMLTMGWIGMDMQRVTADFFEQLLIWSPIIGYDALFQQFSVGDRVVFEKLSHALKGTYLIEKPRVTLGRFTFKSAPILIAYASYKDSFFSTSTSKPSLSMTSSPDAISCSMDEMDTCRKNEKAFHDELDIEDDFLSGRF